MVLQNIKLQVTTLVLVAVLSVAYIGNQNIAHGKSTVSGSRAPASIESITIASTSRSALQLIEENELAEEVAVPSQKRNLASVGQPANDLENLRIGVLEGKYAIKMDGKTISEISFKEDDSVKPTIISDRMGFLDKYAEQFGAASKPQRLSSVLKGEHLVETYRVKSANGPDRLIQVTLGEANGFIALRTETAPTLKLF